MVNKVMTEKNTELVWWGGDGWGAGAGHEIVELSPRRHVDRVEDVGVVGWGWMGLHEIVEL